MLLELHLYLVEISPLGQARLSGQAVDRDAIVLVLILGLCSLSSHSPRSSSGQAHLGAEILLPRLLLVGLLEHGLRLRCPQIYFPRA